MDRLVRLLASTVLALSGVVSAFATGARPADATTIDPCSGGFGYLVCVKLEIRSSTDYTGTPLTGSGTVTSDPPGIDCAFSPAGPDPTTACYHYFTSSTQTSISVALTATPDAHSVAKCIEPFPPVQWYDTPCNATVVLSGFTDYPVWDGFFLGRHTVSIGSTVGKVTSSPAGIDCGNGMVDCSAFFADGTALTLTASLYLPLPFQGWTGACAGQGLVCHLTVTTDVTTTPYWAATPATPSPTDTSRPTVRPSPTAVPTSSGRPRATGLTSTAEPAGSISAPGSSMAGVGAEPSAAPDQTGAPIASGAGGSSPVTASGGQLPPIDLGPIAIAIVVVGVLLSLAIVGSSLLRRRGPAAR